MPRDENLVFSTDGSHLNRCAVCGRHPCECGAPAEVVPGDTLLRMRLDKKGRKGKAVTVVYDLPANAEYFAGLLKKLKAHCGTGGAMKEESKEIGVMELGVMELQGDQRERVQAYLEGMGFKVRRSGG